MIAATVPTDVCSAVPTVARGVCTVASGVVTGGPAGFLPSPAGVFGGISDGVLGGLTSALADGTAWFIGKIADLLDTSTDVHLSAGWFAGHYTRMVGVAAALTVAFLLVTAASAVVHRDPLRIGRSLPMVAAAGLGTGAVITVTGLLLAVSDGLTAAVTRGSGGDLKTALTGASHTLSHFGMATGPGAAPIIVALLTGVITVAAGLLLWIELMLRQAAVYAGVLFFPIALAGLAWEPSRRWARRLTETLVALIFSKFVIAAVMSLAAGGLAAGGADGAGAVLAGAGLLWVAALTPFLLMRLIGVLEVTVAAAHMEGVRSRGTHTSVYYGQSAVHMAQMRGGSTALPAAGAAAPYAAGALAVGHLANRAGHGPAAGPANASRRDAMTTTDTATPARATYRFSPRPTAGLLLGLDAVQLALIGLAAATVVVGMSRGPVGAIVALLVAAPVAAAAFVPVGGVRADRAVLLATRRLVGRPAHRVSTVRPRTLGLPVPLDRVSLLPVDVPDGGRIGVLVDPADGRYTAALAVHGGSFALVDVDEQDRRVSAFGRVLAALARDGSPLSRLQWLVRTTPEAGNTLAEHWAAYGRVRDGVVAESYGELVATAGPVTEAHETLVVASLDVRGARRAIRQAGGGQAGATTVLCRELARLADQLTQAELTVHGALPPRGIARLLRTAYDPASLTAVDRRPSPLAGVSPQAAGPVAAETEWSRYRTDGGWHATYWISEWPRVTVPPDFLSPLLLAGDVRHTVALVAEPLPTAVAARKARAARTADAANATLRQRVGQLTTERMRAEADEGERRERELVAGHAAYRYAGFVTVTALSPEQLDEACGRLEHSAAAAHLELRLLYGQQDTAFALTLPLGRSPR